MFKAIFALLLVGISQSALAVDVDGNVMKAAIAANELGQHIDHTITNMKSVITYRTRSREYGPTLYRVQLDYKLSWTSGYALQTQEYLILLETSGSITVLGDYTYYMQDFQNLFFSSLSERMQHISQTIGPGWPIFSNFQQQAKLNAESFVAKRLKPNQNLITERTLLVGRGTSINSSSILFRFEVVHKLGASAEAPYQRQYIVVLVSSGGEPIATFEEDPKFNSTCTNDQF